MQARNEEDDAPAPAASARAMKATYISLVLLRFVFTALPGYIHPDEFFQSGQEENFPTWDFEPQHAIRSIVPPWIMTLLPLKVYSKIKGFCCSDSLSGYEILLVPRLWMALLSVLTIDRVVRCLCIDAGKSNTECMRFLLVLASSWPALVLLNRPFTNSLETIWLALLWLTTFQERGSSFLLGILCGLGFFTRITFVCFAAPGILLHLNKLMHQKNWSRPFFMDCLSLVTGFTLMASIIVGMDSLFYNQRLGHEVDVSGSSAAIPTPAGPLFLTPLNFLRYNSDSTNLEDHGLHPHFTHVLVNMPLLFGPLAIALYANLFPYGDAKIHSTKTRACWWTIASALVVLSLPPHQEPRFLLPLLIPIIYITGPALWGRHAKLVLPLWICFNCALGIFFGALHQSGVVPSLLELPRLGSEMRRTVLYYKTYMPPTFLARGWSLYSDPNRNERDAMEIVDLKGANESVLIKHLNNILRCGTEELTETTVYVVAPTSVTWRASSTGDTCTPLDRPCWIDESLTLHCSFVRNHMPHITTEDFPVWDGSFDLFLGQFTLSVWKVHCSNSSNTIS